MAVLRSLLRFRGRTGRLYYWLFYPIHAAVYVAAATVFYFATEGHVRQGSLHGNYVILVFLAGTAVIFLPAAAVTTRRLHDRGRSGWWLALGGALAFLAIATVLKYAPSFNSSSVHTNNLVQATTAMAGTAMLGYVPWSAAVLAYSRGSAEYGYLLPALVGVGPLLVYGVWFLIEVGVRRGITGANAYGLEPTRWLGSDGSASPEAGPRAWIPIGCSMLAGVAGIVLLSGVLESRTLPCDMAQTITPATSSNAREFEDCFEVKGKRACAPRMVVIPAGTFRMGGEAPGGTPIHTVTLAKPFAMGKFEITAAQWETCVADGGCVDVNPEPFQQRSRDITGARCRKPAGPDWDRITGEYLPWLSRVTGKPYRLPSESEWEYAARAGTTTKFATGGQPSIEYENYDDATPGREKTIKGNWIDVGSLKPNPFGLYDMLGNTEEWVADIYNFDYEGAPADGSAWTQAKHDQSIVGVMRVVRGGGWATKPNVLSPGMREGRWQNAGAGFRVALSNPDEVDEENCLSVKTGLPAKVAACTRVVEGSKARGLSSARLASAYRSRAYALLNLRRLDEALADLQSAMTMSDDAFLNVQIGQVYLAKKEYQSALDAFDALKAPGFVDAQVLGRAEALEGLGRKDDAVAEYLKYENAFSGTTGAAPRKTANDALVRLGVRAAAQPAPTIEVGPKTPCSAEQMEFDDLQAKAAAAAKGGDRATACELVSPMSAAAYKYCGCHHRDSQSQLDNCLSVADKPTGDLRRKFSCP